MDFVRPVDWSRAQVRLDHGYLGQYLYWDEACVIIVTKVPPGAGGPPRHIHPSDQSYYVMEGELGLSLGSQEVALRAGSSVFIPAGLPHQNHNRGTEVEMHLEVIAPGILPSQPVAVASDAPDAAELSAFVSTADPSRAVGVGFTQDWLIDRKRGASNAGIYLAEVPPKGSGPSLHVHEFDQFYFVLDGVLSVEIGFHRFDVGPQNLIVLPAQVPHRQWNEQDIAEHHLTILVPEPELPHSQTAPWDVAVSFEATGESIL